MDAGDDAAITTDGVRRSPAGVTPESAHKDHFLQLMFFRASRSGGGSLGEPRHRRPGAYTPLPNSRAGVGERYQLPVPGATEGGPVRLDSPATDVMTDLHRISAVTVDRDTPIVEANRIMIARGVRALFVVDEARQVLGIITATDILGERPMQFAQARGIRHDEVAVRDIMTPAERLEVLQLRDVLAARVGDVVATLRSAGRQHALVVDTTGNAASERAICGMFSLTQIARRLGIAVPQVHDVARTFAEVEALIASN